MKKGARITGCLVGVVATVLLSGCENMSLPKGSGDYAVQTPAERQAKLVQIEAWITHGECSVTQSVPGEKSKPESKPKSEIADFVWQQVGAKSYRIRLQSALNLYFIQLQGRKNDVMLWKDGTTPMHAKTPEALLQKAVGWYLPVTGLYYWYRGLPAPKTMGKYEAKYDQYGHLIDLQQDGWDIHYGAYWHDDLVDLDLPKIMDLKTEGLQLKIVTREWELPMRKFGTPKITF